jgi:cytochrome P450/nitrite reductase/ring-hydroxylating ferredoxin subunit
MERGNLEFRNEIGPSRPSDGEAPSPAERRWVELVVGGDVAQAGPHVASAGGVDLVLLRTEAGLRAFEGRCPHQGTLLGEGQLEGGELVCRAHGWRFDAGTGRRQGGAEHLRPCPLEERGSKWFADVTALDVVPGCAARAIREVEELPGPKGLPLLGNLLEIDNDRLHLVLENWARTHGDLYTFRLGPKRALVVSDPALVEEVLRARPQAFRRVSTLEPVFAELGMPGVFSVEGAAWRAQRPLVMQALAQRNFTIFFPQLQAKAERLLRRWQALAAQSQAFDVVAEFKRFTTDVTVQIVFGYDVNAIERDDDRLQYNLALLFPAVNRRLNAPFPYWRLLRGPQDRRVDRAVREIRAWLSELLQQTRVALEREPTHWEAPRNLLEAMVASRDDRGQPFSDEFILGNALQLLVAGVDTTAAAAAWAVHELCDKPDVVAWLRAELDAALPSGPVPSGLEGCGRLDRAGAIAQEALRRRAVAPLQFMENNDELVLGGIRLPKASWVVILTRLGGLDEKNFERPHEFEPQRWLTTEHQGAHTPSSQMPFGSGSRMCPGRSLANLEMRLLLAVLFRNFEIQRANLRAQVSEHFALTLEPHGLEIRLQRRVLEQHTTVQPREGRACEGKRR